MSKAMVDPAELRRFARDLKRFDDDLQRQVAVLQSRLRSLGETWRDQEQREFSEQFELTVRALKKFTEASSEHVPFLLRKADRIDEYLKQR